MRRRYVWSAVVLLVWLTMLASETAYGQSDTEQTAREVQELVLKWFPLVFVASVVIIAGILLVISSRIADVREKTGGLPRNLQEIQKVLESQRDQERAHRDSKWEYCTISVSLTGQVQACKGFRYQYKYADGETREEFLGVVHLGKVEDVAKAIAILGDQRWEMVAAGGGSEGQHNLYFRRPAAT